MSTKTNITTLRRQRGWTQEHLALESGVTVRTIQRLESGEDASLETLRLVATALDVNIQDLFQNIGSTNKEEDIMDLDNERITQIRRRCTEAGLYKKLLVFGFLVLMIGGATLANSMLGPFSDNLSGSLFALFWIILWPLGFAAITAIRNLCMEPAFDSKYPLTVGMDLSRRHDASRPRHRV